MSQIALLPMICALEGRRQRDIGIARVINSHSRWIDMARELLPYVLKGKMVITGEEIRFDMLELGLPEPRSPNAWGALTRGAALRGMLVDTGTWTQAKHATAHARRLPIWRVV